MNEFDLRKYLKHNPLLKEYEEDEFDRSPEMYSGGKSDREGTEVSQWLIDSFIEGVEAQSQFGEKWDIHAEEGTDAYDDLMGAAEEVIAGTDSYDATEEELIAAAQAQLKGGDSFDNMFKGTTPDDINFEGKVKVSELKTRIKEIIKSKVNEGQQDIDSYIKKWNDKMKGSSRSTAKDWVEGIKGISKEDKESILKGIKGSVNEGFKDYLGYSEKTEEFPKTLEGEGYGIIFRKIADLRDGKAKYEAWFEDFKNTKKLDTFVFGSRKELDHFVQDYILPKGATQSSQF